MECLRAKMFVFGFFVFLTIFSFQTSASAQGGAISGITFDSEDSDFRLDEEWDVNEESFIINDPFEKYNRFMFKINDKIYKNVFIPLSKGYDFLVPRKVQGSINNFAQFVGTPKRFFNNLFQKKPKSAFIELERLLINSTLGIGGLFNPAESLFNLEQQSEDFGQTLGVYDVDAGPYIVWPIIGPSTRREVIGLVGDYALNPFTWLFIYEVYPEDVFRGVSVAKRVNNYSYNVRDAYGRITESAIDPYIALQHAFIENRNKQISQ